MKPSSVVFLAIGLVLVIAGLLLCNSATKKADAAGYNLFEAEYDENGNTVKSYSFSDDSGKQVKKLCVQIDGVDVEIIGGKSESKVDVYNMTALGYTCSISSQVMTVSNHFDLSLLIDSGGSAFNFNGIRKYFDKNMLVPREKYIKIYISDAEDLSQIELDCMNCKVTMTNVSSSVDLIIGNEENPCKKATIEANGIHNASSIVVFADNCELSLEDVIFKASTATLTDCDFTFKPAETLGIYGVSAVTGVSGDIYVNSALQPSGRYQADYTDAYPCLTVYQTGGSTYITKY